MTKPSVKAFMEKWGWEWADGGDRVSWKGVAWDCFMFISGFILGVYGRMLSEVQK